MLHSLHKEKINAIHDDDLEQYLENLGIFSKFQQGELKCKFCREPITFDNLHSLFPQSGDIKIVCTKPDCVRELSNLLREGAAQN